MPSGETRKRRRNSGMRTVHGSLVGIAEIAEGGERFFRVLIVAQQERVEAATAP